MKIDEIINEENNYAKVVPLTVDELSKYKNEIKAYIDNGVIIYRGMGYRSQIPPGTIAFLSDGSTMNREAANTSNFTNMLTSVLPSWKGWPPRPKSFICSLKRSYASRYGSLFIAIPLENQPIGLANKEDFWETLPVGFEWISNVDDFNETLESILEKVNREDVRYLANDANQLFQNVNEIIELFKNPENFNSFISVYREGSVRRSEIENFVSVLLTFNSAESFFDSALNPGVNNNLYQSYKQLPESKGEAWMSGKVLFISEFDFDELTKLGMEYF